MWAQGSGWDLEGPKNPDGLNPSIYVFVYMYKVHMCMYMLGGGMRSWTNCFFLETFLSKLFAVTILQERDFKSVFLEKTLWNCFLSNVENVFCEMLNGSNSQTQSNISCISSKAEIEVSFLETLSWQKLWASGLKIGPATGVRIKKKSGLYENSQSCLSDFSCDFSSMRLIESTLELIQWKMDKENTRCLTKLTSTSKTSCLIN